VIYYDDWPPSDKSYRSERCKRFDVELRRTATSVRVHTVILIFHPKWKMKKWKMDTHFPFSIYDEK